ncbi:MAG TPA: hypothetical protein VFE58_07635 [Tepidisphaeraceae bacterium]|jgi:hypothetical protein|nr:hypothetical protein [Tepidisphaeraceae bacterium]
MSTSHDSTDAAEAAFNLPILPETSQTLTKPHTQTPPPPSLPTDSPTPVEVHRTPAPAPPGRTLSPRQLAAIPLLLEGYPDAHVAAQVGVTRESVNRWRNHHPAFIAHLNRQRQLRLASAADRYHALLITSMHILEQYHGSNTWLENKVKPATALLREAARRTFTPLATPPPTNTEDVLTQLLADDLPISPDDSPNDDAPPPPPPPPLTPKKSRK